MSIELPKREDRIPGVIYADEFEVFVTREWKEHGGHTPRQKYRQIIMDERGLVMHKGRIVYVGPENRWLLKSRQTAGLLWRLEDGKQVTLRLTEDEMVPPQEREENSQDIVFGPDIVALNLLDDQEREELERQRREREKNEGRGDMSEVFEQNRRRDDPPFDPRLYEGLDRES